MKKNEKVFRILTVDWLASIDEQLKDGGPTAEEMVTAVQAPLGELRIELVARLSDLSQTYSNLELSIVDPHVADETIGPRR